MQPNIVFEHIRITFKKNIDKIKLVVAVLMAYTLIIVILICLNK